MEHDAMDGHDERFSIALGSTVLARRITDAVAMMLRGLPNDPEDRRNKDALLHVICSLYEPLDRAAEAIESLTETYAPQQAQGRAAAGSAG